MAPILYRRHRARWVSPPPRASWKSPRENRTSAPIEGCVGAPRESRNLEVR